MKDVWCVYPFDEQGGIPKCANNPILDFDTEDNNPVWVKSDPDYREYVETSSQADHVNIPTSEEIAPLFFTMFAVAKSPANAAPDGDCVLGLTGPGGGSSQRLVMIDFLSSTETRFLTRVGNNNNYVAVATASGFGSTDKWQAIVGTFEDVGSNNGDTRIYVDGSFYANEVESFNSGSWILDDAIASGSFYNTGAPVELGDVRVALSGFVQRRWTDTEIRSWSYDPWQIFDRPVINPVVFMDLAVAPGANPKGPLGMPLHGPFAGPIAA